MPVSNTPNQTTPLLLERARSFALRLSFILADDTVVNLTGGTITFTMLQPRRQGEAVVLTKNAVLVSPEIGYAVLDLQAAELDLEPAVYPYSITYIDADAFSSTVVKGEVQILSNTDPLTANVYDVSALDIELGFNNVVVTVNHLQAPTLQIGTVETVSYGTAAGAGIRGGYPHQLLDLKIPKGAPGGSQAAYDEAFGDAVAAAYAADAVIQAELDGYEASNDAVVASIIGTMATDAELAAHEADTSTHGVATVAGVTEAQAFQNKDLSHPSNVFPASLATDAELSAAIAAIPPQDTVYLADKNLIDNGGFEVVDGSSTPVGWYTFWVSGAPVRSVENVLAEVYEGAYCAKVILDEGETQRWGSNVFAVAEYQILKVRGRFKVDGTLQGMISFVSAGAADPDPDYFAAGSTFQNRQWICAAADGWKNYEFTFVVPAGDTKARVFFSYINPAASGYGTRTGRLDKTQCIPEMVAAVVKQPDIQVFTNPGGTWTKPDGAVRVHYRVEGGGGQGGGCAAAASGAHATGGGGAAGGYAEGWVDANLLGDTESITVGAGGSGAAAGANGNSGTGSAFGGWADVNGGGGGFLGPSTAAYATYAGGGGGVATIGDIQVDGQHGEPGQGSASLGLSGRGGHSHFGQGGRPSNSNAAGTSVNGNPAVGYGSGGAGALATSTGAAKAGGAGAPGLVIVETYFS